MYFNIGWVSFKFEKVKYELIQFPSDKKLKPLTHHYFNACLATIIVLDLSMELEQL